MNYGIMIKNARVELGLYLRELSEENLSFNLLSNIEKGKTKLTKQKGLMLYKRILEYSWEKNIFPEINFDELLKDTVEYTIIRKANKHCLFLKKKINFGETLKRDEYLKSIEIANDKNIGLLSYFIYSMLIELLPEEMGLEKLNTCHDILDFLRWFNLSEHIDKFKSNLEKSIPYSYQYNKIQLTIKYYNILLAAQKKYHYRVDFNSYFNLAILNKREKLYDISLYYLKEYLKSKPILDLEEEAEVKIIEASLLSNMGNVDDALVLYSKLSKRLSGQGIEYLEALCYGNSIHRIFKHKIEEKTEMVTYYLKKLDSIIKKVIDLNIPMDSMYSNIAQGNFLIGNYILSKEYFLKSLECTVSDRNKLVVLEEALALFTKLDEVDLITSKLYELELSSLQIKDMNILYEMIIKIMYLEREQNINVNLDRLKEIFMRRKVNE